ncbi:MAG: hypothetical protein IJ901_10775 [Bacteroidaceae bacterium]|nr:hypothetical protein [Bacteroidaceae bacterium]
MNALDYILANYQQEKYQASLAERAVLRALVHTLNKEELLILQKKLKRGSSKWSVGKGLYEEAIKVMGKIQPHRNESISALLKAFTDKQSGKVADARAELRDRFGKQSFLTQRKILKAMLNASKQDRIWAYNRLNYSWDGFFFEDVKTLWEQYHEKECGIVIIKHFPMEYVYDNLSALNIRGNYTNLCIKLIHHPKFQIDKKRLKEAPVFYGSPEVEYLYILAKSKSKIEKGEATRTLFNQMAVFINIVNTPPQFIGNRAYNFERQIEDGNVTTKHLEFVSCVLWCMGELGLVEELIAFEEWDNIVKHRFYSDEEVEYLTRGYNTDCIKELWNLYRQTIVECLPNEYQQLVQVKFTSPPRQQVSFEEMIQCNPALNTLVDQLGLELT